MEIAANPSIPAKFVDDSAILGEKTLGNNNKQSPSNKSDTGHTAAAEDQNQSAIQIVWRNVLIFVYLHVAALYGFYLCFTVAKLATLVWCKSFIQLILYFAVVNISCSVYHITYSIVFFCHAFLQYSVRLVHFRRIWHYGWGSSTMGSPLLQSEITFTYFCCCGPNSCFAGKNTTGYHNVKSCFLFTISHGFSVFLL